MQLRRRRYDTRLKVAHGALRRAVLIVLGSLVLFANFGAEMALVSQPAPAESAVAALLDEGGALCTSAGPASQKQNSPSKHLPRCAFCLPLLHGSFLVTVASTVDAPQILAAVRPILSTTARSPTSTDLGSRSSRGPPLTA